jgi:hypothetical protein
MGICATVRLAQPDKPTNRREMRMTLRMTSNRYLASIHTWGPKLSLGEPNL